MKIANGPFPGIYQSAYVTPDMAKAQAFFGGLYGITRYFEMRDMHYETGPGREAVCHVALAYVGAVELEIIQPLSGDVQLYRDFVPHDGAPARFHHFCRMFATEAEFEESLSGFRRTGRPLPIVGTGNGIRYFYADFRPELGHYLEHIWFPEDAFAQMMPMIPRF